MKVGDLVTLRVEDVPLTSVRPGVLGIVTDTWISPLGGLRMCAVRFTTGADERHVMTDLQKIEIDP